MRIGLEVSYAFMGRGGIDRYAHDLAGALLAPPAEEDYILLTLFAPFRRRDLAGAPIRQPAARKLAMAQVELLRRLWSRLGRPAADTMTGPVDVLHTTHHFAPPVRRARLVVTVHDLSFEHPEFEIAGAEIFSRDTRRAVERADAVVVPSAFVRDELAERYRLPAERAHVIPSGVDAARWSDGVSREAQEPYFLAAGQIEPRKNLLELAHGLALARERGLPHRLRIAGRVARGGEPIVTALRRSAGVEVLGFVPDAELLALYRGATAFVYPSRYEGFGLSLLEAMAAGTPVIASAASSLPEVVAGAGLLVEPGDPERWAEALALLASDEALRTRLIAAGRERAAERSWDRAAEATVALYRALA